MTEDVDELKQDAFRLRAEAEGIACANPRVVGSLAAQQCPFLSAKHFTARHDCFFQPTGLLARLLLPAATQYCQACISHPRNSCCMHNDIPLLCLDLTIKPRGMLVR